MISIIVAIDPNYLMGNENGLPWNIREDMIHFKNYTLNKTVLMGKNTFLTINKPLPNRTNIVVCNDDNNFKPEGVIIKNDLFKVLEEYKNCDKELVVMGGAMIYSLALPFADKLIISHIKKEYKGHLYFPKFDNDFIEYDSKEYDEFIVKYYRRK